MLEHTRVEALDLSAGVCVRTDKGNFSAAKLVVAAGAWLPELVPLGRLRGQHFPLEVTLESGVFFRPHRLEDFLPQRFPIFIAHHNLPEDASRFDVAQPYGFPVFGLPGLKLGLHHSGEVVTASSRGFEVPGRTVEVMRAWLERHLPAAAGPVIHAKTCLYTNTANHDFLLDTHASLLGKSGLAGGSDDVLIVSPCSGHGFKFVPFLGELVADLVLGITNPCWFGRFRV